MATFTTSYRYLQASIEKDLHLNDKLNVNIVTINEQYVVWFFSLS